MRKIDKSRAAQFEALYAAYNRPEFIEPDPLQLVLRYDTDQEREIAGLIASSLALGRVRSIVDAGARVLNLLGPPYASLLKYSNSDLDNLFGEFTYRFYTGRDLISLLTGIRGILENYGSLGECFRAGLEKGQKNSLLGLAGFANALYKAAGGPLRMIASPEKQSACKRLHLYLRWMIRNDAVDPGAWSGISPAILVVPMDVHMHSISLKLGLTSRRQPDLRSALEVTDYFRTISPNDPVRYDFCLTRMGIHPDLSKELISKI